ncbi:WYL domain-containing protein [Geodermatophilus sp. SYSU D01119]
MNSTRAYGRRWYLVAWDPDRRDWRSFLADRMTTRSPNGARFVPREPPEGDVVAWLSRHPSARTWPVRATVRLHEPAEAVADRVRPGMGVLEAVDATSCHLGAGADDPAPLLWMVTSVDADFTVLEGPPELSAALQRQARRCAEAVAGSGPAAPEAADSGRQDGA